MVVYGGGGCVHDGENTRMKFCHWQTALNWENIISPNSFK